MDIRNLFQQAQQIQSNLQDEMEKLEMEADSGGGMVRVRMNGKKEILSLLIDPGLLEDEDIDMLQDLIIAAVNQASRNVDQEMASKLGSVAGHLKLPGLFK